MIDCGLTNNGILQVKKLDEELKEMNVLFDCIQYESEYVREYKMDICDFLHNEKMNNEFIEDLYERIIFFTKI